MPSEFLSRQVGATKLNGDGVLVSKSLFETLDPAHVRFTDWVYAAVNAEFAAKGWAQVTNGSTLQGNDPVETKWLHEPDAASLRQTGIKFPMLCVWPNSEAHTDETLIIERITTLWSVQYILGPLTPELHRRIGGAMRAFPKLVRALLQKQSHPAFDDGKGQIHATKLNWSQVRTVSATFGKVAENDGSFSFYGSTLVLETIERLTEIEDDTFANFIGMNATADMDGPGGSVDAAMAEEPSWDP